MQASSDRMRDTLRSAELSARTLRLWEGAFAFRFESARHAGFPRMGQRCKSGSQSESGFVFLRTGIFKPRIAPIAPWASRWLGCYICADHLQMTARLAIRHLGGWRRPGAMGTPKRRRRLNGGHMEYPASCILRPASCDLRPATCDLRPATCILHPASCILHPAS